MHSQYFNLRHEDNLFQSLIPLFYLYTMIADSQIPEPLLFNPLKHHLGFIREFIYQKTETEPFPDRKTLIRDLRHLGRSVMDVYSGTLSVNEICSEIYQFLEQNELSERKKYAGWTGTKVRDFRLVTLSDGSLWALKYHDNESRFVHIFPSRGSLNSFRVKSNTLKSALLYHILIGKDYITSDDLNKVRPLLGLSPVKDSADTEAITDMIEILRNITL